MNFKNKTIRLLIILELLFLICGVFFPIAKINELWIFNSNYSLYSILLKLFNEGETLIGIIVAVFGILFPFFKIISRFSKTNLFVKNNLQKFSMLDIFILSLIIFSSKTTIYFEIDFLIGFYFLIISIGIGYINSFLVWKNRE